MRLARVAVMLGNRSARTPSACQQAVHLLGTTGRSRSVIEPHAEETERIAQSILAPRSLIRDRTRRVPASAQACPIRWRSVVDPLTASA
jgi:hypothetical protein